MIQAEKLETFKWSKFKPGYVSVKRNGIHTIYDPKINKFYSRTPREIVGLQHLVPELKDLGFPVVMETTIPGLDFETASGLIRSSNDTPTAVVSIFNSVIPGMKFEDRYHDLLNLKDKGWFDSESIKIEPMIFMKSPKEMDNFYKEQLRKGEEGICWISPSHIYQPGKRTWDWMKLVPLKSIEATIIDILPGTKGKKYEKSMGFMYCKAHIGGKDTFFKVGIFKNQTDDWRQSVFNTKHDFLGEQIVVEFKAYSKYGVPTQPRFKAFRWDL